MTDKELLCNIYKCILKFAGCTTDEKGNILIHAGTADTDTTPLVIEGKSVVLPTQENLTSGRDNIVVFHPLAENIYKEERPVLVKLRSIINVKLNIVIGVLVQHLLNIVASPELHKELTPEQMELVIKVKNVDKKTLDAFVKSLIQGSNTSPDKNFIFIYLKKRAKIVELNSKGEKEEKIYSRGGIVSFPFYTKLEEKDKNKRIKDTEAFKSVFEYVFADINNTEFYNSGSSSRQAPSLEAILKTAMNLGVILNDHINMFSNFIDGYENLLFDTDFYEYLKDDELISKIAKAVPPQDGSEGIIKDITNSLVQTAPVAQESNVFKPFANSTIKAAEQPKVISTSRGLDWNSLVNSDPTIARNAGVMFTPGMGMQQNGSSRPTPGQRPVNNGNNFNRGYSGGGFSRNFNDSSI